MIASWTEPFSPDATFVTVFGQEFENRDVNRNKHENPILAGVFQGSCIVTEIRRLRLVRPDVAVVALDVRLHVQSRRTGGATASDAALARHGEA